MALTLDQIDEIKQRYWSRHLSDDSIEAISAHFNITRERVRNIAKGNRDFEAITAVLTRIAIALEGIEVRS